MGQVGRVTVRLLAEQLQLAGVDFLQQPDADAAQLVVRVVLQLLLGDGQVLAERLDLQVDQLDGQLEVVAGRPEPLLQQRSGLVELSGPSVDGGQLQVGDDTGRVGLDAGLEDGGCRGRPGGRPGTRPRGWGLLLLSAARSAGALSVRTRAGRKWTSPLPVPRRPPGRSDLTLRRRPNCTCPRAIVSWPTAPGPCSSASMSRGSTLRTSSHRAMAWAKLPRFSYKPGQEAVEVGVLRRLLPCLLQVPHGQVEQPQGLGRLRHRHLRPDFPRVALQDMLAQFQDAEVALAPQCPPHLRPGRPSRQPRRARSRAGCSCTSASGCGGGPGGRPGWRDRACSSSTAG